jgi:hypothetical protein
LQPRVLCDGPVVSASWLGASRLSRGQIRIQNFLLGRGPLTPPSFGSQSEVLVRPRQVLDDFRAEVASAGGCLQVRIDSTLQKAGTEASP